MRRRISLKLLLAPSIPYPIMLVTKLWGHMLPHGEGVIIAAAVLIAAADLFVEAHLGVAVFLYTAAAQVATAVALAGLTVALLLWVLGAAPLGVGAGVAVTFVGTGLMVGFTVRNRFLASCERRRSGEETHTVRLQLALAVGLLVLLYPADPSLRSAAPWYAFGIGCGFLAHLALRRAEQRYPRRSKLARRIRRTLEEVQTLPLTPVEFEAVALFVKGRWSALNGYLGDRETDWTLGLRIVKATAHRIKGHHLEAVRTLRNGLARLERGDHDHVHLAWLLLALCYRDLGQRDEVWMALNQASGHRPTCLLVLLVKAMCLIEELPLPGAFAWASAASRREIADRLLKGAFARLPEARPESALAAVVACGLPLTRRFVDDLYAYFLLKSNVLAPAKSLFEACLREDSRSASSHLHLAEYYLTCAACAHASGERDRAEQLWRASEFCLRMAVALSNNRDSHTRRRALSHLRGNGARPTTPAAA